MNIAERAGRDPQVGNTSPVTLRSQSGVPVWLLDVDGVVNAHRPGWDQPHGQGRAEVDGVSYRLRWSPALVHYIRAVHHAGTAEVRWATTWVDHVSKIERLLNLPPLETAFAGLGRAPSVKAPELKVTAALHVVEVERRPLIWTDDDAIPGAGPQRRRLEAAGMPLLFLTPDPLRGLQPGDLTAIDDFLGASYSDATG